MSCLKVRKQFKELSMEQTCQRTETLGIGFMIVVIHGYQRCVCRHYIANLIYINSVKLTST